MADAGSAQITRNPEALASALEKLELYGKQMPKSLWLRRIQPSLSCFIVNHIKGDWMTNLFSTHPPTQERIRRLRSMTATNTAVSYPQREVRAVKRLKFFICLLAVTAQYLFQKWYYLLLTADHRRQVFCTVFEWFCPNHLRNVTLAKAKRRVPF